MVKIDMMSLRQVPNFLTLLRMALAIPVALALWQGLYLVALIVFFLAGLSDALDGFLARRFNWSTRLGSLLDPLADKVLLVTTFAVLAATGELALSVLLVILLRDMLIVCGVSAYYLFVGGLSGEPSVLGKICTFLQIIYALFLVASSGTQPVWAFDGHFLRVLSQLVMFSCVISGGHYVVYWSWRASRERARS